MAVTCKRLCMETCFAHPMRPDDLRSRDPRLSSQPTEDQPHGDPRPATRSPESHDPKEAGDQGANHQRQVTTQPEFRRGPRGKSPEGWESRGTGRTAILDRHWKCGATAADIQEHLTADVVEDCAVSFGKLGGQQSHYHPRLCCTGILRHVLLNAACRKNAFAENGP